MAHRIISRMEPAELARAKYMMNKKLIEEENPVLNSIIQSLMAQGLTKEESQEIASTIMEKNNRGGLGQLLIGAAIATLIIFLVIWFLQP
jgi:hypothetical protein